ncbi:MAG: hypothetical protein ACLGIO_04910 [Acidimicrobiia bacterium]
MLAAIETLDPEAALLVEMFRDRALTLTQDDVRKLAGESLAAKGTVTHRPRVVSVHGAEAVVYGCVVDGYAEYDAAGNLRTPAEGQLGRDNRLRLEHGRWRTYQIFAPVGEACA